jgi:hypothetical protein
VDFSLETPRRRPDGKCGGSHAEVTGADEQAGYGHGGRMSGERSKNLEKKGSGLAMNPGGLLRGFYTYSV